MAKMTLGLSRMFTKRLKIHLFPSASGEMFFSTDKDIVSSKVNKAPDILLNNLRSYQNSKEILSAISAHNQILNQRHVLQALESLFLVYKNNKDFDPSTLLENPSFAELCQKLKKHSRVFTVYETIEAMKILTFFKVPPNSTILQVLLQMIKVNINNLNLQQIIFLDFVLKKCTSNPLIDSITLALPLVFQIHLSLEMDHENMPHLSELLHYAARNNLPERCFMPIITCMLLRSEDLNLDIAKSVVWSLSALQLKVDPMKRYSQLLKKCFDVLTSNINNMSLKDVLRTLGKIKDKIVYKDGNFFHEAFITACSKYAIDHDVGFEKAIVVSKFNTRIAFTHIALLDYISQIIYLNPETIMSCRPFELFTYVGALSNANYQPKHWNEIVEAIFKHSIMKSSKVELPWARFASELATLNAYNDSLLNRVFSEDFLAEYLDRDNSLLDHLQLLQLYQAVKAFHPSYTGNNMPQKVLEKCTGLSWSKTFDRTIKLSLEMALGGPQYVAPGVVVGSNGAVVDFIVAFRDGNFPIALYQQDDSGAAVKFENLSLHKNSQIVCILPFHKGCYSINAKRLRGNFDLSARILESMGFAVVPVSINDFTDMPAIEKIPFLMREINLKCSKDNPDISIGNQMS